jgi:hypothetical protein
MLSVRSLPIIRTVSGRPVLMLLILAMAIAAGTLAGVLAAGLGRPQVAVVQAQVSTTTTGAVEVPRTAVVIDAGQQVVFVVVNGVVIRQPVQAVASAPNVDVVTSGLSPHAPVVTSPVGLHDGEKVRTP